MNDWGEVGVIEMDKYPMTYEVYEKRVVELFLEDYEGDSLELMKQRVDDVLSDEPNFIQTLYGYDCFTYESPHIYGETCKRTFEDNFQRQTPVANLRLLIG